MIVGFFSFIFSAVTWAEEPSKYDQFKLWNKCKPMGLSVIVANDNKLTRGELTEDTIATIVRNKLQDNQLYDPKTNIPFLHVVVDVFGDYIR